MPDDILTTEESDSVTHLKDLIKAGGSFDKELFKAKGKDKDDDDDDDDDDYDETYMKKNMKTFMKKNSGYMKDMGYMKKAIDTAYDVASENGDLTADATMVDGTEMFKAFKQIGNAFIKALEIQGRRIEQLEESVQFGNEVITASGEVLIKASETLDKVAEMPTPVKSQTVGDINALQKAKIPSTPIAIGDLLQKAQELDIRHVKGALYKAATENGNAQASLALSKLEMSGNNPAKLDPGTLKTIVNLAQVKE